MKACGNVPHRRGKEKDDIQGEKGNHGPALRGAGHLALLGGCAANAQKPEQGGSESDALVRDADEEVESQGKRVPYDKAGAYIVTLKESDFQKPEDEQGGETAPSDDQAEAPEAESDAQKSEGEQGDETTPSDDQENASGDEASETEPDDEATDSKELEEAKVTLQEAEAARDEARKALDEAMEAEEQAKSDADAQAAADSDDGVEVADDETSDEPAIQQDDEALSAATEARAQAEDELAKAEEAVKAAEEKVSELEGQEDAIEAEDQADAVKPEDEAKAKDKKDLAFADVKAEDVKVSYFFVSADSEAAPELREAQIDALSNDGGAITLSFTDPDAATNLSDSYVVAIEALELYAVVDVDMVTPVLSVESDGVTSDSESCDVSIRAQDGAFASDISEGAISLGGSFSEMAVNGVEASGDALTVHLSGSPARDYETEATWVDGQVTVAADGFESSPVGATAYVPVDLPDEAFDLGGEEALPTASVMGEAEYVGFEGDVVKATLDLYADMGTINDVKAEDITLGGDLAGGEVESVSKEGEDNDMLRVEVSFPRGEETEDDYLYLGTLTLAAGAMSDESGNAAPEVSTSMFIEPEDMGRAGDDAEDAAKKAEEAKKKKQEAKAKKLSGIGEGFKYASGWVEQIDPALASITDFGASVFGIASSYVKGEWLDIIKGGVGLLQMCGVIPAGEKEVTPKDVLKEVKSLRTVVNSIDLSTKEISKEDREDRFTQTKARLELMQDRITSCYVMFDRAAEMLAEREDNPMNPPAADASNEEAVRYNTELANLMLQQQALKKAGKTSDSMFIDVEDTVAKLREDLSTVCKWVSIDAKSINAGANPIDVLDKLVSMKFNWDTQGYYARAAFRVELDATIKDAWAVVSTFYNATDPVVAYKYQPELDNVKAALRQIALRPAGQSPEEVRKLNQAGKEINVYSPTLGYSIKQSRHISCGYAFGDPGEFNDHRALTRTEELTQDDQITKYRDRLYNGDIWEDLKLAGLDAGDPYSDAVYNHMFNQVGIGFRQALQRNVLFNKSFQIIGQSYESWVRGLRPDKSIVSKKVMEYYANTLDIEIWGHFYWFDRR